MRFFARRSVVIACVVAEHMRQVGADDIQIAWRERPDMIADYDFAFAFYNIGDLHLRMLVQVVVEIRLVIYLQAKRLLRRFRYLKR